ncbi:amino acid ABC transporter substrate-binding protein, PAAT family (TC 3.A.1.3.-) [Polaromonas sp. OV174]|uniref:amino acid ABC transporter substrate-binding protein n=1 Tax=Polaromonas sp. OV174 TaxID=1855300 RepID=UPI0008F29DC6|nr:amino acid ABC transporter substrate-binding protein [Polaromonas sp. OV174]SFB80605.1 amino acid ABC transporter substrate-binding protein, PAAT family (TC 3.A.1.3.-) [Polaromonas sp. OV174]
MKKPLSVKFAALMLAMLAAGSVQANDALKKMKETGTITMGVRESSGAMSYTLGANVYAGFHHDVCQRVLADIQKQLGVKKLDIKYQSVTPQNRIPLVQNGTVDIECGTTTNSAARQKDVAFAPTLYVEEVRVAVKTSTGFNSIAQLANKTVSATTGTTSVQLLRKHERANKADIKALMGKDNSEAFLLLESGRADANIADGQILATLISMSKNSSSYRLLDEVLSIEPIAIMLNKNDVGFKKAVDDSIKAMAASGEIAKLYDKWFMQPIPPNNTKVGLPPNALTKAAWANPSDKPLEDYLPN